jgi:hypothetical protein
MVSIARLTESLSGSRSSGLGPTMRALGDGAVRDIRIIEGMTQLFLL